MMTVFDVLALSARMLRKNDIAQDFENGSLMRPSDTPIDLHPTIDKTSYEYKLFISAFNTVYDDLVTQYALFMDEHTFTGNKIKFSEFAHPIAKIIEVRDARGNKPKYMTTTDSIIFATTSTYRVLYSYRTGEITGDAILEIPFLSATNLAYGVSAEYCLLDGLFDEAQVWIDKYKEALQGVFRRTKNIKMRARVWQ